MGQEVKNPLRAQSKYGLMGSSAKTGKKFFRGSPEHFLDKNAIWDRTLPHLHINCSVHVWGRAQGSQIFKRNSIISIRSKVMAFLVILWSPCCPHRPRVIPVVPMSSPHHPHRPNIVPMSSPSSPPSPSSSCCPHSPQKVPHVVSMVCGLHMLSPLSPSSPRHPCHPHVIPVIPTLSRRFSHHPHPPRYPFHPLPTPWLGGGPESVKMQ